MTTQHSTSHMDNKSGTAPKRSDIETQFGLSESFNKLSLVEMEDKESGTTVTEADNEVTDNNSIDAQRSWYNCDG